MGNCQRKGWLHQIRCPRRPRCVYLGGKVCVISAMGIPGVVGDAPQTAGLLFGLLGHPPLSVCLSLVPAPKAHNPPDMGSVQAAQRVCAQPGRTHSL